jgi:hypothetical protein
MAMVWRRLRQAACRVRPARSKAASSARLQPRAGLVDGVQADLGHAREHGVDALGREDGRGGGHEEQT